MVYCSLHNNSIDNKLKRIISVHSTIITLIIFFIIVAKPNGHMVNKYNEEHFVTTCSK